MSNLSLAYYPWNILFSALFKEAHTLLKHTDWSIGQVANGLGFEEPAYFANFFKKYTGSSPATYRLANI